MEISDVGIKMIKRREGLALSSYPDPESDLAVACRKAGINPMVYMKFPSWRKLDGRPWTIGYGETHGVQPGQFTTIQEAEIDLKKRISVFTKEVLQACASFNFQPNSNQLSAMVCFSYNLGMDDLQHLMAKAKINQSDPDSLEAFAVGMLDYCHSKGKFIQGLLSRRKEEKDLFLAPISSH